MNEQSHAEETWWERRLMPSLPPLNLAVCRIVVASWILFYFWRHGGGFVRSCTRSPVEQFRPIGVVAWLEHPMPSDLFNILVTAMVAVAVLVALGVFHRVTGPIFGLLVLVAYTYRNSWGFIFHTDNTLVFAALIIGFSPASATWSFDALLASDREKPWRERFAQALSVGEGDWRFGWPVQLLVLASCLAYFVAGTAKIGAEGLAWGQGEVLRGQILRNATWYEFIADGAPESTRAVLAWPPWMFQALASGSLILECGAPLALWDRRLTLAFGAAMFAFHWGVYATMGIPFGYHLWGAAFAAFVPWDWIAGWIERARRGGGEPL